MPIHRSQNTYTGQNSLSTCVITQYKWARPWENVSYVICEQQRRRSACASAQSDQRLCCSLPRQKDTSILHTRNFKILAGLCSWAGQFVSCLVGVSRRHIFSWHGSNEVHLSSCNTESFTCTSHHFYDLQIPRLTNNYTRGSKTLEISSWNVNGLFKTINNQKFSKLSSKAVVPMLFLILCSVVVYTTGRLFFFLFFFLFLFFVVVFFCLFFCFF